MKRKINRELDCCIKCGNIVYPDDFNCCGYSPAKTETLYELDDPNVNTCVTPSEYVAYLTFTNEEHDDIIKSIGGK